MKCFNNTKCLGTECKHYKTQQGLCDVRVTLSDLVFKVHTPAAICRLVKLVEKYIQDSF